MRILRVLFIFVLTIVGATPAFAEQGALEATLTVSDSRPSAEGAIYSWDLEIKTPIRASSIRVTLPENASGAPFLYLVDGLPDGSLISKQGSIEYTFATAALSPGNRLI